MALPSKKEPLTQTNNTSNDFAIKDIELADFGRKEIEIAEREMPGLMATRAKYGPQKPLAGYRVMGSLHMTIQNRYATLTHCRYRLMRRSPMQTVQIFKSNAEKHDLQLHQAIQKYLVRIKERLGHLQIMLEVLNPEALLQKGYSITRTVPQHKVVTSIDTVANNQILEILLAKGRLHVMVKNLFTSSED